MTGVALAQLGDPTDTSDSDGDGLSAFVEAQIGTDPELQDTDGDGLSDGAEVEGFTVTCDANTGEPVRWFGDPLNFDSNDDGVIDDLEWNVDTDGDCTPDLFDLDNDGDGVPDRIDAGASSSISDVFDNENPLELTLRGLDSTRDLPTVVEFQLQPDDPTQLRMALRPMDWPADTAGQIMDLNDGVDDKDMVLIPMLEITVPKNHVLPDKADLDEKNIQVKLVTLEDGSQEVYVAADGSRQVYVPLTLVKDPDTGADVAFGGRMLYSSSADWSDAQDVKLLWLVQVNNDIRCDLSDSKAVDDGCTNVGDPDIGYVYDVPQVVHAYYEPWTLTGLSVSEQHGTESAVIFEDPAVDDDLVNIEPTARLASVLSERFLATNPDTGDLEITPANIAGLLDRDLNDVMSYDVLPDVFQVEVGESATFDKGLKQTADRIDTVLEQSFAPKVGSVAVQPLITTVMTSSSRSMGLDTTSDSAVVSANRLTIDLGAGDGVPIETIGSLKWNPYCATGATLPWRACSIDEMMSTVDQQQPVEALPYDPEDPTKDLLNSDPLLSEGQLQFARLHALSMMTGQTVSTRIESVDGQLITLNEGFVTSDLLFGGVEATIKTGFTRVAGFLYLKNLAAHAAEDSTSFLMALAKPGGITAIQDVQAIGRLKNAGSRLSTAGKIGTGVGLVVAVAAFAGVILSIAASDGVRSAGAVLLATALGLGATVAVWQTATVVRQITGAGEKVSQLFKLQSAQKYLGVSSKIAVIGALIAVGVSWGFFIYQMVDSATTAWSPVFNAALAAVIADSLYIALITVLSATVVGALVVALVVFVDAIISAVCESEDNDDCANISSAVTSAITYVIFGTSPMVDVSASDLISVKSPKITLDNPELGFVAGNAATIALPVDTTITHTSPDAWQMAFYQWLYSKENIRSGNFEHALSAPDAVDQLAASSPGSWDSVVTNGKLLLPGADGLRAYSDKDLYQATKTDVVEFGAADVVNFDKAGLNQSFPYTLNSAYTLPSYECWTVPGPPPFFVVPVCYDRTVEDTTSSDLPPLVYDILPAILADFVKTSESSSGIALAWDPAFEPIKDFDNDGLDASADGGFDPDDNRSDADGDGLTDRRENELREAGYAVSPVAPDIDNDGLNDRDEVAAGTNPTVADTDNDGLIDGVEVRHLVTGVDGVTRLEGGWDVTIGDRTVRVYSDPLNRDSDGDGLSDPAEKALSERLVPADRIDEDGWPYHPKFVNASPISITMEVPSTSGFFGVGDSVDVTTTVTTAMKLAPSVLDVTWPANAGPSPAPTLLDFDPAADSEVRQRTETFTVPEGSSSVEIEAGVRAWFPANGEPVTTLETVAGSVDISVTSIDLQPAAPDAIDDFVISGYSSATNRVFRVDALNPASVKVFQGPASLPFSSACNNVGVCMGVWKSSTGQLSSRIIKATGNLSDPRQIDAGTPDLVSVASDGTNFGVAWSKGVDGYFGTFDATGFPDPFPVSNVPKFEGPAGKGPALELLWARDRYVAVTTSAGTNEVNCLFAECSLNTLYSTVFTAHDMASDSSLQIAEFNRETGSNRRPPQAVYDPGSDALMIAGHPINASRNY